MSESTKVNISICGTDGDYEANFKCKTNDGIDIDYTIAGEDIISMLEEMLDDVTQEMCEQVLREEEKEVEESDEEDEYIAQLEKIVEDLMAENRSLKTDNDILQRRADDAVNNIQNAKKDYDIKVISLKDLSSILRNYYL